MTSALLARLQLLLTQPVTQPEREPNVGTEREIGAARGGVAGCHVFSRSKKKKDKAVAYFCRHGNVPCDSTCPPA